MRILELAPLIDMPQFPDVTIHNLEDGAR